MRTAVVLVEGVGDAEKVAGPHAVQVLSVVERAGEE